MVQGFWLEGWGRGVQDGRGMNASGSKCGSHLHLHGHCPAFYYL